MWMRIEGGVAVEMTDVDPAGRFAPSLHWEPAPDGAQVGDAWTAEGGFAAPAVAPAAPTGPRYVRLSVIRERAAAAGKWVEFAHALDSLPPEKRWLLQTLEEGVASDDPDATALLTAIGCDPAQILAE